MLLNWETSIFPAETLQRYLSWNRPDLLCPRLELCEGSDDGGHHTYCFSGWILSLGSVELFQALGFCLR